MMRVLILIHGGVDLIQEGWPRLGLPWERLVGRLGDAERAR